MIFPGILVPFLGGVSKEGGIAHVACRLPFPVSWIPRKIRNKSRLKNPIDGRFLTWLKQILGQLECGSMSVLGENPDRFVSLEGNGGAVCAGSLNSASVGRSLELLGADSGEVCISDLIHPLRWDNLVSFLLADPISHKWFAVRNGWVPGDAGDNEIHV